MPRERHLIDVRYRLTFDAPFHCGTGLREGLLDRTVQRDTEGHLLVPGSTIKGALRQCCEHLATLFGIPVRDPHNELEAIADYGPPDVISRLFGTRVAPCTLRFDDALLDQSWQEIFKDDNWPWQTEVRTQVSISRMTHTAHPALLFTSEYGLRGFSFTGQITGLLEDWPINDISEGPGTFGLSLLITGLLMLERLGGNRSAGLGACHTDLEQLTIDREAIDLENTLPAYLTNLSQLPYISLVENEGL
jgi:CRISPR/Cas system CSM-associated protein Csm3 (group 7 of RAMP superfamily)